MFVDIQFSFMLSAIAILWWHICNVLLVPETDSSDHDSTFLSVIWYFDESDVTYLGMCVCVVGQEEVSLELMIFAYSYGSVLSFQLG